MVILKITTYFIIGHITFGHFVFLLDIEKDGFEFGVGQYLQNG